MLPTATLLALGHIYEVEGPGFTGVVGERPVASAGLRIIHSGVADAWAFISRDAPRIAVYRHIRGCLYDTMRALRLRRVQAGVLRSMEGYCRWLETLGFSDPQLLRSYGPNGEDFLLYSIVTGK